MLPVLCLLFPIEDTRCYGQLALAALVTNTTCEFGSGVRIACMMNTNYGFVGGELALYGEHRFTDALSNKRYSSKIIKAGALLPDTKLLLET